MKTSKIDRQIEIENTVKSFDEIQKTLYGAYLKMGHNEKQAIAAVKKATEKAAIIEEKNKKTAEKIQEKRNEKRTEKFKKTLDKFLTAMNEKYSEAVVSAVLNEKYGEKPPEKPEEKPAENTEATQ